MASGLMMASVRFEAMVFPGKNVNGEQ
jgi:acyl dehydratase